MNREWEAGVGAAWLTRATPWPDVVRAVGRAVDSVPKHLRPAALPAVRATFEQVTAGYAKAFLLAADAAARDATSGFAAAQQQWGDDRALVALFASAKPWSGLLDADPAVRRSASHTVLSGNLSCRFAPSVATLLSRTPGLPDEVVRSLRQLAAVAATVAA